MQTVVEDIRQRFENSAYFTHMGFEIVEFDENNVLLKLPINENHMNVNGTLHGGVHATMLDQVLGMLISVSSNARCATINLNVNYLAPTDSGEIFANARILNQGYRIVTAEAEILDGEHNILAKAIGTFKIFRDR